jgi:Ala-tRNA(Pro) deacylase
MDMYQTICARLDEAGTPYRVIEHAPEGRTDLVSALRGHPVTRAAKCIILIVKVGKKSTRFVLAVIRGDGRVDMSRVRTLYGATYAGFAAGDVAERLAGSALGTVLPFAMTEELSVVVDPALLEEEEFFFNAARLDRSLAMRSADYVAYAAPRIATIGQYPDAAPASEARSCA